jgi:hypothetical protein
MNNAISISKLDRRPRRRKRTQGRPGFNQMRRNNGWLKGGFLSRCHRRNVNMIDRKISQDFNRWFLVESSQWVTG